ncbi:trypsin 3A1 [Drosophila grimshawi]|uniref:trypsin n=1 Tax=Drosophila grimshawi TaxID=7222 RepID=B4J5L3_DROGR|nr:trypsin 3A1 [Drosophila grimshawi]EDW00776.1 GH20835 [Drosophila grimshawi]
MTRLVFLCTFLVFTCGSSSATPPYDGRIVGGQLTDIRDFPYQASIQLHGQHICGGAIIGDYFILTAAHCFTEPWVVPDYSVRVGATEHASGGELLSLRQIIRHGAYNSQTHDNDLALLLLNARLNYTEVLQAVQLASAKDLLTPNTRLLVSGWGYQSESGEEGVSPALRYVDLAVVDPQICRHAYRNVLPVTKRMLCAARDGQDSCQGDSGGPLVGYQPDGTQGKLYGIVSWGIGCAQPEYPGVYTSVASFRNWIDAQVGAWGWNSLLAGWSGLQRLS